MLSVVVSALTTRQSPTARACAGMPQPRTSACGFRTPLSLKGFRACVCRMRGSEN